MEEITIEENQLSSPSFWGRIKDKLRSGGVRVVEWWRQRSKFQKIGLGVGLLVMVLIMVFLFLHQFPSATIFDFASTPTSGQLPIVTPQEPRDHTSPLDGVLITKAEYEEMMGKWPLAIIVENNIAARSYQTGLNEADLVYEVLVEGGITRFMPIYWRGDAEKVSPVRSIRSYFLDWVTEFSDAVFMHIGIAGPPNVHPEANAALKVQQYGMKSLGLGGGGQWWWRYPEIENTYMREHSAYTSTQALWEAAKKQNWCCKSIELQIWKFKADAPAESRPSEGEVKFSWGSWSDNGYQVRWGYDFKDNVYRREHGGAQAKDSQTGQQVWAKNLVIQFARVTPANDEKRHILYQTTGEGKALVFRDGKAIEGVWKKPERNSRTIFYDTGGQEVEFNRGRTWIAVVPLETQVSHF